MISQSRPVRKMRLGVEGGEDDDGRTLNYQNQLLLLLGFLSFLREEREKAMISVHLIVRVTRVKVEGEDRIEKQVKSRRWFLYK